MLEARPDRPFWGRTWVESTFRAHLNGYDPDGSREASAEVSRLDGWSVGGCMGAETLVQSRPVARRSDDPVTDLLRAGARCSLGLFHSSPDDAPPPSAPPRVARFRRWMAVLAGPGLCEESRAGILRSLPAFLARDAARAPDSELLLLALLDRLYAATGFQNAYAEPDALADAIARFADDRGDEVPKALFVSDGRTLGILLGDGCLLSSHPPAELRPSGALLSSSSEHIPAAMWMWTPQAPATPPRDAERLGPGIFTALAAEPGVIRRR